MSQWYENPNLTQEMCTAAVFNSSDNFQFVPSRFRSAQLCELMLRCGGGCKPEDIPDHAKTHEVCMAMLYAYPDALKFIPEGIRTSILYEYLVRLHPAQFLQVPDQFKTERMCDFAVWKLPHVYTHVPDHLKTARMYESIRPVKSLWKFVPERHLGLIYNDCVNGEDFWYLPVDCMTQANLGYDSYTALKNPEIAKHVHELPKEVREVLDQRGLLPLDFNPLAAEQH